ncbi:MAG TPA: hypothetical protein VGI51_00860 [Steroidobacteraceae bacterium]|jgi:hypothetical protein
MHDKERLYAARSRLLRWGAGALLAAVVLAAVLIGTGLLFRGHLPSGLPAATALSKAPNRVHSALVAAINPPVTVAGPSIGKTGSDTSTIEICGKGKVTLDASDPLAAYRYIDALSRPATQHWLTALLDSDDYHARAAGLFLEGKITDGFAVKPIAEQTRDALVQLAVGTHDPGVYAIAVRACNAYLDPAKGACEQISLREWARIDADNAVPWLLLAGAARAKNNPAAEAGAFNQAAKARRIDSYYDSLLAFTEADLSKDATPVDRWYLAVAVMGIEASTALPEYGVTSKHCSTGAMQDDNVRQQCGALAELLVSRGMTLLDLSIGAGLGARVGWPQGRVDGLTQERDALTQTIMQATPAGNDDLWTCNGAERGNAYVHQRVQLGELGSAREARERSGETAEELARKQKEYIEKLQRDFSERWEKLQPDPGVDDR